MKVHLHAKTASQNTVSQVTGFCGFLNGFSDTFGRCLISPSKKYIPLGGLDGKGGNEHSFQQLMRMPLQQPAVFECPGFHFVSIADDVFLCRSEEHTSELQSLMRTSYAVFCLKKKKTI